MPLQLRLRLLPAAMASRFEAVVLLILDDEHTQVFFNKSTTEPHSLLSDGCSGRSSVLGSDSSLDLGLCC